MYKLDKTLRLMLAASMMALTSPMTAHSADILSASECVCAGPAGTAVNLTGASGDVLISGPSGFEKAPRNSELNVGTQIATGLSASGNVSLSNGCSVSLDPDTTVDVTAGSSGGLCVTRMAGGIGGAGTAGAGGGLGTFTKAAIVGGVLAVPLIIFLTDDDDDDPASP